MTTNLPTEELHERYRSAANPVERTHWHILWLMKEGHSADEGASMLGSTARWIRPIVGRWNRGGERAILDQRRWQKGAPPLLSVEQQKELDQALEQSPADGGLWTGPKVAAWMQDRLGRPVDPRRGWGEVPACRVRSMSRVTRPSKPPLKKLASAARCVAPGVSRSPDRAVEPG